MRARLFLLPSIAVLLLLGAMAAACGGGGADDADDGEPAGEGYFRRVESLTADVDERSRALSDQWREDIASLGSEEERLALSRDFYGELFSLSREFQDGLEDIEPPEEVADVHDEFMQVADDFFGAWADIAGRLEDAESDAELNAIIGDAEFLAAGQRLVEACTTLEGVAADMGVDIDLACAA